VTSAFVPLRNEPGENRCFCNTAVQFLLSSSHVRNLLAQDGPSDPVLDLLRPLYKAQEDGITTIQSTNSVLALVAQEAMSNGYQHNFNDSEQHDSFDFLEYLLESSPHYLQKLFKINVHRKTKCQSCDAPEYMQRTVQQTSVEIKRPEKVSQSVTFAAAFKDECDVEKRCGQCSPPGDRSEAANRHFKERMEVELAPGARHLLLKIPLHMRYHYRDGSRRDAKLNGKLTQFKTQGLRISGANMRTDAAAVKLGDSVESGHYWALTRHEPNGWLRKDDGQCSDANRFLTNLKEAYYVLLTKV